MKLMEEKYPAGAMVRLVDDSPEDPLHEVTGHMHMYGYDYLIFTDGYMALTERVVG